MHPKLPDMKITNRLLCAVMLTACTACSQAANPVNNTPVASLDLERYMGTWYEIARYDHSFERGLERVQARYELRSDGRVTVHNSGYDVKTGDLKEATGKAHAGKRTGTLRVSFFWFFYSDYIVMEMDSDYQWALVGSKSANYLWILSRTPELPDVTLGHIRSLAQKRGYDIDKLLFVTQK